LDDGSKEESDLRDTIVEYLDYNYIYCFLLEKRNIYWVQLAVIDRKEVNINNISIHALKLT